MLPEGLLAQLDAAIAGTALDELPGLVGALEAAKARAWARLTAPGTNDAKNPDRKQADVLRRAPVVPDQLDDKAAGGLRAAERILAVANAAAGPRPVRPELALAFCQGDEREQVGTLLLTDLIGLLDSGELQLNEFGLSGETMIRLLRAVPDRPWATWGRSRDGLTVHALARLLRPYGLRPEQAGPERRRVRRYDPQTIRDAAERIAPLSEQSHAKCSSAQPAPDASPSNSAIETEHMSTSEALGGKPPGDGDVLSGRDAENVVVACADDVYRHHGRDYRVGDTLPDGRVIESIDFGIPVLPRRRQREVLAEPSKAEPA